jgi:DNA polymerase-3 subunit delta'
VRWIEPQAGSLKIAQIRQLTRQLMLAPLEGPWQIAILDRFDLATAGAANALLKTLEEPPPTVVLALLSQHAEALLPTIVSRCQVISLRPIPRTEIKKALIERWQVPSDRADFLSQICSGRLGWAVTAATSPEPLEQRDRCFDNLGKLLRDTRVARFAYAEFLARQPPEAILEHLELWASWWRDILLLTSHSSVPLTNLDRQSELTQLAKQCTIGTVQSVLSALRTTANQLSRNANPRLALEVLFLNLPVLS